MLNVGPTHVLRQDALRDDVRIGALRPRLTARQDLLAKRSAFKRLAGPPKPEL
jgi:hypothetical protein